MTTSLEECTKLQRVPYALQPASRTKFGLLGKELLFFLIDLTFAGDEIDLVERDDLGLEVELVASPEDEEGGDGDIGGDECIGLEGNESVIALEEGDDGGSCDGEV